MEVNIAELLTIITSIAGGVAYLERKNKRREKRIKQDIQRTKENLQKRTSMLLDIAKDHTEILKADDKNIDRLIKLVETLQNDLYTELRSKKVR